MILQFGLAATLCLTTALGVGAAEMPATPETGPGCCRRDADIARWHKLADRLYAQFKPAEAIKELQKILEVDGRDFEALIKIARAYIDIGDTIAENGDNWKERKLKEYVIAEGYARNAIKVDPRSTWGHFWLAAALGNAAMVSPIARQLELAGEIRAEIERALALDPKNGFAYHAYGVWHRKIIEVGALSRVFASVLYGQSVPTGSLEKSIEYLKRAVEINPTVIVSRLELARSHVAKEEWEPARVLLKTIPSLPIRFSDDAKHKKSAEQLLAEINDR
ncbi:MAG: tetratricopeptide repeat protein [Candidatus Binatia bacterium]